MNFLIKQENNFANYYSKTLFVVTKVPDAKCTLFEKEVKK